MGKLRLREIKKLAPNYIAVKWLSWDLNSGLPNRWTHLAPMITNNINLVPTTFYIPNIYWMASIHYPTYTALQPHKVVTGILTQLHDRGLCHTVFGLFYALNKFPSWIYEHLSGASDGKESTCNAGDQVWPLGREDPLQEEMAIHYSILTWRTPWAVWKNTMLWRQKMSPPGQKVSSNALGKSGGQLLTAPERMKWLGQNENNIQLWR